MYTLGIPGPFEDEAATGDLDIRDDLTLTGAGAGNTIINGGGLDRVFHIVLSVHVTIAEATIQNGLAGGGVASPSFFGNSGGGIFNNGALTLSNSTISQNHTGIGLDGYGGYGGGIFNYNRGYAYAD